MESVINLQHPMSTGVLRFHPFRDMPLLLVKRKKERSEDLRLDDEGEKGSSDQSSRKVHAWIPLLYSVFILVMLSSY
ncbi:unnamed protein product [Coffea canephora]|uniref:Transmembrane protein n=1 Tax=Coffea canephora TaxID=49390 RepID=A0A068TVT1_COFCA|nr:unnamed protein product [Coffea canephora]